MNLSQWKRFVGTKGLSIIKIGTPFINLGNGKTMPVNEKSIDFVTGIPEPVSLKGSSPGERDAKMMNQGELTTPPVGDNGNGSPDIGSEL